MRSAILADLASGDGVASETRLVELVERGRDVRRFRFLALARVYATHHTLQLGKFANHARD